MPSWTYSINLRDVFYNDDYVFEDKRDAIVNRLRASRWYRDAGEGSVLHCIVRDLADSYDTRSFDAVWNDLYDEADADRCWIAIN